MIVSDVLLVPCVTVVLLLPPSQVIRVMELALGAVAAGPMPAPVMFRSTVAEAVTVILIFVAFAEISRWETCSRQFRVALSVLDVPESLSEKMVVAVSGASTYPLVTSGDEPLMMGFAPLPYAPNVMGEPLVPLDGIVSEVPYQTSPLLNRTESPAENVDPFTFEMLCQACAVSVPVLASLPVAAT